MKQTIDLHTFRDAFLAIRPDNFSWEGLEVLFDYLTCLEEDTGKEMELDVIALCCDYSEASHDIIAREYDIVDDDGQSVIGHDDMRIIMEDWLVDRGAYVGKTSDGQVVYCTAVL